MAEEGYLDGNTILGRHVQADPLREPEQELEGDEDVFVVSMPEVGGYFGFVRVFPKGEKL